MRPTWIAEKIEHAQFMLKHRRIETGETPNNHSPSFWRGYEQAMKDVWDQETKES